MKEEKGGILHVLFFFVGITLISIGVFYVLTDEHIELKEEYTGNNNSNTETDKPEVDVIKQISLMKNVETELSLRNGNAIKITYSVNEETNAGKFIYDGRAAFETEGIESCDMFYLYNDSIVIHCSSGIASSGYLYILNSDGVANLYTSFKDSNNNDLLPETISLKDGKIVVNGVLSTNDTSLIIKNEEVNVCLDEEKKEKNITDDYIIDSDYTLSIKDDAVEFVYLKTNKTVADFVKENCKTVEE